MPAEDPAGAAAWSARGRLFVFAVLLVTATNLLVLALAALDMPRYAPVACGLAGLVGGVWLAAGPGVAGTVPRGKRQRLQLALVLAGLVIGSGLVTLKTQTRALFGPTRMNVSAARAPEDRRASAYRFAAATIRPEFGETIRQLPHTVGILPPTVMPLVEPGWRWGEPIHYWAVYDMFPPATPETVSVGMRIVADRALYTTVAARAAQRHGLTMAPHPVFVEPTRNRDRMRLGCWSWFGRFLLFSAGLWGAALVALARSTAGAAPAAADRLFLGTTRDRSRGGAACSAGPGAR